MLLLEDSAEAVEEELLEERAEAVAEVEAVWVAPE